MRFVLQVKSQDNLIDGNVSSGTKDVAIQAADGQAKQTNNTQWP